MGGRDTQSRFTPPAVTPAPIGCCRSNSLTPTRIYTEVCVHGAVSGYDITDVYRGETAVLQAGPPSCHRSFLPSSLEESGSPAMQRESLQSRGNLHGLTDVTNPVSYDVVSNQQNKINGVDIEYIYF